MAVFQRPVQALRAVFRAQGQLTNPPGQRPALYLKAGIHAGPCVAVTLNEREPLNPQLLAYLNRLSDHLFVAARYVASQGEGDVLWRPGATRG